MLDVQCLRRKFAALNAYIRKKKDSVSDLSFHFQKLEKEEHAKTKVTRNKKIK